MSPCPRPAAADRHRLSAVALACWRAAMLALMSSGPLAAAVGAAESCRTPGGQEQPPVAQLVSVVGEVTVRGVVQPGAQGTLPFVPICAGDPIAVGSASRAAVYVLEADTPLRLDEDTVGRIRGAARARKRDRRADAGSGLLPEPGPAHADHPHALRECRHRGHGGLSARARAGGARRARGGADRARGACRPHSRCGQRGPGSRPRRP